MSSDWSEWVKRGAPLLAAGIGMLSLSLNEATPPAGSSTLAVFGAAFILFGGAFLVLAIWNLPALVKWRTERKQSEERAALGFEILGDGIFKEGELYGARVQLRPKGAIEDATICIEFDAPLTRARGYIQGGPGGRHGEFKANLDDFPVLHHSARTVEVPLSAPPVLDPDLEVTIELLSLVLVRATRIYRK